MRIFSALYDRILAWAAHRYAVYYLAGLSFIEAFFFPIPPDFMLAPMSISRPKKAFWYATLTTVSSVCGGILGYCLGMFFIKLIEPYLIQFGYEQIYHQVQHWFLTWGIWVLLFAGITPIPFKIYTITSGAVGLPFIPFIFACTVGRGIRFYFISTLMWWGGEEMKTKLRRYIDWVGWGFAILLTCVTIFFLSSCTTAQNYAPVVDAWHDPTAVKSRYRVQKEDTVYSIALAFDMDYKDIVSANHLVPPYKLKPGQTLCMQAPQNIALVGASGNSCPPTTSAVNDISPLEQKVYQEVEVRKPDEVVIAQGDACKTPKIALEDPAFKRVESPVSSDKTTVLNGSEKAYPKDARVNQAKIVYKQKGCHWQWPVNGAVVKNFCIPAGSKGIDIAGELGTAVKSVASGKVVYSGSGLRGYGNLIIIKHSADYLTAYAYNRKLLVKEGDLVKGGSEIAKMGQNEKGQIVLHFEVRHHGKPVDPLLYL